MVILVDSLIFLASPSSLEAPSHDCQARPRVLQAKRREIVNNLTNGEVGAQTTTLQTHRPRVPEHGLEVAGR